MQDYANAAVNQLLYTLLLMLSSSAAGGDAVITCIEAQHDWLQLRLMNNRWHVQHYANEATRVAQIVGRPVLLFYYVAKWQNSCTILVQGFLIYSILL